MNHRGVEFTDAKTASPGIWRWQFRIGDTVSYGPANTLSDQRPANSMWVTAVSSATTRRGPIGVSTTR